MTKLPADERASHCATTIPIANRKYHQLSTHILRKRLVEKFEWNASGALFPSWNCRVSTGLEFGNYYYFFFKIVYPCQVSHGMLRVKQCRKATQLHNNLLEIIIKEALKVEEVIKHIDRQTP